MKKYIIDWGKYFSEDEFKCSATGECNMDQEFINKMNQLREYYGQPMVITSGYRARTHPIELKKKTPGVHHDGLAADVKVSKGDAYQLMSLAFELGFTGIGVQQKGSGRFIHLDTSEHSTFRPRPTVWSY